MASVSATCLNFGFSQLSVRPQNVKLFPMAATVSFPSTRTSRFRFSCSATTETVQKVCEIVKKQLALPAETELTPESKFSDLGADSLDTVEIVMGLEEEFDINVEEENSENIATVQQAADLIDKLIQQKAEA